MAGGHAGEGAVHLFNESSCSQEGAASNDWALATGRLQPLRGSNHARPKRIVCGDADTKPRRAVVRADPAAKISLVFFALQPSKHSGMLSSRSRSWLQLSCGTSSYCLSPFITGSQPAASVASNCVQLRPRTIWPICRSVVLPPVIRCF